MSAKLEKFDLTTPEGRRKAHSDYLWWGDHAFLRKLVKNRHWVDQGRLLRGNQPSPTQLQALKAQGIKTIINLRGGDGSFSVLERDACNRLGLTLVDHVVTSREIPTRDRVLGAKAMFAMIEYPAFIHCKSGADRAGLMSALYVHFQLGQPIRQAMKQLSWRYLHARIGKTGVLMLTRTLAVTEAPHGITVNGVSPGTLDNSERKPPLEMVPAGRFGRAEEVARAVLFLADPASGYITGTNIKVSGGYLI